MLGMVVHIFYSADVCCKDWAKLYGHGGGGGSHVYIATCC